MRRCPDSPRRRAATLRSKRGSSAAAAAAAAIAAGCDLVLACNLGFIEGVEFLISVGARVDEPNNTGETPLISAVHRRDVGLVRALLKAGANPDRPDNSGRSARDYAALDGKGSAMLGELENAAKAKAANPAKKSYGPTF